MESEETFDEIHHYLSGEGTPAARAAFEQRMASDEALAAEVAAQRRIRNGLKANEYKKLFKNIHDGLQSEGGLQAEETDDPAEVQSLHSAGAGNLSGERATVRYAFWPYLAAAASILLAIGLVWYFNASPETTPVASEAPVPPPPAVQDAASPKPPVAKSDLAKTPMPKRQQQPEKAPALPDNAAIFAQYFDPNATLESPFSKEKPGLSPSAFRQWRSDTAHVYAGIRLLAQREGASALAEFQQTEASRYPQARQAAEWYAALAYLQQGDVAKCKVQLQKIAADAGHNYGDDAVELASKLP